MRLIQTAIILCTLLCFLVDAASIPTEPRNDGKSLDRGRRRRPAFRRRKKEEGLPKYFHEPGGSELGNHYDSRFEHGIQDYADKQDTQLHMLRAYLTFFNENHMETWLAHGTLLGWWWNGKVPAPVPAVILWPHRPGPHNSFADTGTGRCFLGIGTSIPKCLVPP